MKELKLFYLKVKNNLGFSISILLHTSVFLLLLINFSYCHRKTPPETIIAVDILPISNITNVENKQNKTKREETEKPKQDTHQPIQKPVEEKQITKEKPEAKQNPEPEPIREVKPEPKKESKPEAKKENKIDKKQETKNKPVAKPSPEKKKDKKKSKPKPKLNEYDTLMNNLLAENPSSEDEEFFEKQSKGPSNPGQKLSLSLRDSIKKQIERCWSPPAGNKDAGKLQILLEISFDKDGTVANAEVVNSGLYQSDEMYKVAADAALRAVYKCSPLEGLPADQYKLWRHIEFNFDPSNLIY